MFRRRGRGRFRMRHRRGMRGFGRHGRRRGRARRRLLVVGQRF